MTRHDTSNKSTVQNEDRMPAEKALRERLLADARRNNRTGLFAALAAADITYVFVKFDGYGDSGQIENIEVRRIADPHIDLPSLDIDWFVDAVGEGSEPVRSRIPVAEAIETTVYSCLEQTHRGWEDNEGAHGEFTFDVARGTITLDYHERYIATGFSQHEF